MTTSATVTRIESAAHALDVAARLSAAFAEGAKAIRVLHVYYHVLKQPTVFLAGEFRRSLELAETALPLMPGMYFVTEHALYRTLARTALLAEDAGSDRAAGLELLRKEEETFRTWAEASPSNHAHRHALVAAEIAALRLRRRGALERLAGERR